MKCCFNQSYFHVGPPKPGYKQKIWEPGSLERINLKFENVIYFAYEVTFRLNYEKSFIKNQLVLAVLEKIKSCGRWWGNDLVL